MNCTALVGTDIYYVRDVESGRVELVLRCPCTIRHFLEAGKICKHCYCIGF